ncbi:hypothetical protein FJY93_02065 [Candidatus Kaiserbacteria bacterium]|nr:hypothetical protein [Candidatus Kaiserbacteria bacterium]
MEIRLIHAPISHTEIEEAAQNWHGSLVKGVVDVERGIVALGGEWHMDANILLIADGSQQEHVWGFNIYPDSRGTAALEFVSLINIRPGQGNRGMEIEDETLRSSIANIVRALFPSLNI